MVSFSFLTYGHLKLTVCLINFYIVRFKFCSSYKGLTSVHIHLMASGGYFGPSGGSRGLCWCRSLESHWWCHCNRKFWQVSLSSFHDVSKKGTDFKNKCTCKDHHTTMLHKKEEMQRGKRSTMIISGKPSSGTFMATKLQIGWVSLFHFSFSSSSRLL